MAFLRFSFNKTFYLLLFAFSTLSQIKVMEQIEYTPQILFMILDSFSLLFLIIIEDISLFLYQENSPSLPDKRDRLYYLKSKLQILTEDIDTHIKRIKTQKTILLIIILGILNSINSSLTYIAFFCLYLGFNSVIYFFNIITTYIILLIWLRQKIYRHHIVALIILLIPLIGNILLNKTKYLSLGEFFEQSYYFPLCVILIILSQSFREVIEKYAFEVLFMRHFRLLFYEGVVSLIVNLIVLGILKLVTCPENLLAKYMSISSFCNNAHILYDWIFELFGYITIHSLYIYLYVIVTGVMNSARVLVNKTNGVTHRYTADLIAYALMIIIDNITTTITDSYDAIVFDWYSVGITILFLFGSLIYNENIQIVICNLSVNTRYEIEQRALSDAMMNNANVNNSTVSELNIIQRDIMDLQLSIPSLDNDDVKQ